MRRIITVLMLLLMSSASFGGISEDMNMYIRKDVFEVYMQNLQSNTDRILQRLDVLEVKITDLSNRVSMLTGRVGGIEDRVSDLRNDIYLWLVILGIIIALPSVQKMLQAREERKNSPKHSVTLDEVKRLIEEHESANYPQRSRTPS